MFTDRNGNIEIPVIIERIQENEARIQELNIEIENMEALGETIANTSQQAKNIYDSKLMALLYERQALQGEINNLRALAMDTVILYGEQLKKFNAGVNLIESINNNLLTLKYDILDLKTNLFVAETFIENLGKTREQIQSGESIELTRAQKRLQNQMQRDADALRSKINSLENSLRAEVEKGNNIKNALEKMAIEMNAINAMELLRVVNREIDNGQLIMDNGQWIMDNVSPEVSQETKDNIRREALEHARVKTEAEIQAEQKQAEEKRIAEEKQAEEKQAQEKKANEAAETTRKNNQNVFQQLMEYVDSLFKDTDLTTILNGLKIERN
ncbi:MAG: hypothetical protein FWG98_12930, partial [Candidatus Cloacimonetes bacterium]|nr:hypothetical protein [Candidatus Cloacimonadota bacterium]